MCFNHTTICCSRRHCNDQDCFTYCYIIINDTHYRLKTAVKAIDICLKLYSNCNTLQKQNEYGSFLKTTFIN